MIINNIKNINERKRFYQFAVVGLMGAVIDFGIFNFLISCFGIISVWSSVVSFSFAVVSNFLWNRMWTYPDSRSKSLSRQLFQFCVISVIGLGIRTPLFAFLEMLFVNLSARFLPKFFLSPTFLGHNVSLAVAIVVVLLWNFAANRLWTYNDVKD
jgi:putative flippase GtrA